MIESNQAMSKGKKEDEDRLSRINHKQVYLLERFSSIVNLIPL